MNSDFSSAAFPPAAETFFGLLRGRSPFWKLRTTTLCFGRRPLLMGILNITPDSFSDGGLYYDPGQALDQAQKLVAEGADILDVGAESTRPYSHPVTVEDELQRLIPVLKKLVPQVKVPVSVDTSKAAVAERALGVGVEIINDVTGLTGDSRMALLAAASGAGVCAMHMQGTPQNMQDNPTYGNVVEEIAAYLQARKTALLLAGIEPGRICLDPGIGFGKSHEHNLQLLQNCYRFHATGCPILVGPSRKGFIGKVLNDKLKERDSATAGIAIALAVQGMQIVRVHNVARAHDALALFDASGGLAWQGLE